MTLRRSGLLAAALICGAGRAGAQVSRGYFVVASGRPLEVAVLAAVYPTCASMGRTDVNLLEAPRAGIVQVGQSQRYPNYAVNNPRGACDKRKVPSTIVTYQSSPGFVGQDSFVIETVWPYGVAQSRRITVNVR